MKQNATHLLNLVYNMCKYEIDWTNIVERTWMDMIISADGQMDGWTDSCTSIYPSSISF